MSVQLLGMIDSKGLTQPPKAQPLSAKIAIEGDSQTNAGNGAVEKLSTVLAERVSRRNQMSLIGTGGAKVVEDMLPRTGTFDALKSGSVDLNIALLWGGTNDIYTGTRSGTDTWNNGTKVWTQGRLAAGWDWVVLVACLPRNASAVYDAQKEIYNGLMSAEHAGLGNVLYVDIAGDESDPGNILGWYQDANHNAPRDAIYYIDATHVTTEGKGLVADMIVDALNTISIS